MEEGEVGLRREQDQTRSLARAKRVEQALVRKSLAVAHQSCIPVAQGPTPLTTTPRVVG